MWHWKKAISIASFDVVILSFDCPSRSRAEFSHSSVVAYETNWVRLANTRTSHQNHAHICS
jgi:hypothetical protein